MPNTAEIQIQIRRGLAADWTSADPTLLEGELGYETDTGFWKWGDGVTAWTALGYDVFVGGPMTVNGLFTNNGSMQVNGNIGVTGTVDGRVVSTDGSVLDNHVADSSIHFGEGSIDHLNILNIGSNSHAAIDNLFIVAEDDRRTLALMLGG